MMTCASQEEVATVRESRGRCPVAMQRSAGGAKVRRPNCLSPATKIRLAADVHRYSTSDDDSGCVLDEYSWVPSGLKPDDVHTYFAALPADKVPFVNSAGEKWRLNQLKYQLPPQDYDASALLTQAERQELQNFEAVRKRDCLGRGQIQRMPYPYDNSRRYCHQCKQAINIDDLVVLAQQRFGEHAFWHPHCFVCVECKELLVELIYYKHQDNVFCGRHHAEQIKPRCAACDELIFGDECTEAEGHVWHMRHFTCSSCSCQLGGMKYMIRADKPFCVPCYHKFLSVTCNTCGLEISTDKPHITQAEIHWHADERCFCCANCRRNLLGKTYGFIESALYCGQNGCEYRSSKRSSQRNELANETILSNNNDSNRACFELRQPKPPAQSPPLPPVSLNQTPPENIYETLSELHLPSNFRRKHRTSLRTHSDEDFDARSIMSCTSTDGCCSARTDTNQQHMINMRIKQRKAELRSKRHKQRRSLSMDGHSSRLCTWHNINNSNDELSFDHLSLKYKNKKSKKRAVFARQNYYSGLPSDFNFQREPYNYVSTSTSESDSDDDIYLNFSAKMTPPQYIARQQQIKMHSAPKPTRTPIYSYQSKSRYMSTMSTPRNPKKKSNMSCFIS